MDTVLQQTSTPWDLPFEQLSGEELCAEALVGGAPTELSEALTYALATKGKGIRPAIVLEAAKYGPHPDATAVRRAATAVELLHVATMMHDDVVDRAALRRGVPTVAAKYGMATATVGGIWLLARFVEIMSSFGPSVATRAGECIARMCAGQMLEVQEMFNLERTAGGYLEASKGKTGALFELSARLGAELSGAPDGTIERLTLYGLELGVSFQIADDVLDLIAGDESTGKLPGNDIRQGVYTLPVIYSLQGEPKLRDLLAHSSEMEDLPSLLGLINACGGITRACGDCVAHVEAAKAAVLDLEDAGILATVADLVVSQYEEDPWS